MVMWICLSVPSSSFDAPVFWTKLTYFYPFSRTVIPATPLSGTSRNHDATHFKFISRSVNISPQLLSQLSRPVYWGSLAHQRSYSNKLGVFFINRDGSDVGNAIQSVIQTTIQNTTHAKLGWNIVDANDYPTTKEVIHAVLDEHTWMAVYSSSFPSLSFIFLITNTLSFREN